MTFWLILVILLLIILMFYLGVALGIFILILCTIGFVLSPIVLILGLIKPKLVRLPSRWAVFLITGALFITSVFVGASDYTNFNSSQLSTHSPSSNSESTSTHNPSTKRKDLYVKSCLESSSTENFCSCQFDVIDPILTRKINKNWANESIQEKDFNTYLLAVEEAVKKCK